jgi:site-specific recombinase XerD
VLIMVPSVNQFAAFIAALQERGLKSSSILSIASCVRAVFTFVGNPIVDSHLLQSVLLGVRKSSPPQPRYKDTWDVSLLVRHIQRVWPDNSALSDEEIRNKAMVLLRLSLLARSSDIARALMPSFTPQGMLVSFESPKETRASITTAPLPVNSAPDTSVCPVSAVQEWISRSKDWRSNQESRFLFLRLDPSHAPLSSQRVAKVTMDLMRSAGIDVKQFKAASTRSAAATKALDAGCEVDSVMKLGRWSSRSVFDKFYNRSIRVPDIIDLSTQVQ